MSFVIARKRVMVSVCFGHLLLLVFCLITVVNDGAGSLAVVKSDPVARKLRLRGRRDGQGSEKVLKVRERQGT